MYVMEETITKYLFYRNVIFFQTCEEIIEARERRGMLQNLCIQTYEIKNLVCVEIWQINPNI